MWAQSPGREDPLQEGTAAHSSILAWRTPWTGEPDRLWSIGSQRIGHSGSDLAQHSTMGSPGCVCVCVCVCVVVVVVAEDR